MKYEFVEVMGQRKESGIYNYSVTIDELNEYGDQGWQFAYTVNDGHTVVMQRAKIDEDWKINEQNFSI